MMTSRALTEYVVLDIEGSGPTTNKFAQADAQVSPHQAHSCWLLVGHYKPTSSSISSQASRLGHSLQPGVLPAYRLAKLCMYEGCCQHSPVCVLGVSGCNIRPVPLGMRSTKSSCLLPLQVARQADLGTNDQTYFVRTHLGNLLHAGDTAVG